MKPRLVGSVKTNSITKLQAVGLGGDDTQGSELYVHRDPWLHQPVIVAAKVKSDNDDYRGCGGTDVSDR